MEITAAIGMLKSGLEPAEKIWGYLKGFSEGLDIEVRSLAFRDVTKWDSVFAVITPHPIAYIGNFKISNGSPQRRGIKKVGLAIGGATYTWDEEPLQAFEPGDVRDIELTFSAKSDSPRYGRYTLSVTDTSGRTKKIRGELSQ